MQDSSNYNIDRIKSLEIRLDAAERCIIALDERVSQVLEGAEHKEEPNEDVEVKSKSKNNIPKGWMTVNAFARKWPFMSGSRMGNLLEHHREFMEGYRQFNGKHTHFDPKRIIELFESGKIESGRINTAYSKWREADNSMDAISPTASKKICSGYVRWDEFEDRYKFLSNGTISKLVRNNEIPHIIYAGIKHVHVKDVINYVMYKANSPRMMNNYVKWRELLPELRKKY